MASKRRPKQAGGSREDLLSRGGDGGIVVMGQGCKKEAASRGTDLHPIVGPVAFQSAAQIYERRLRAMNEAPASERYAADGEPVQRLLTLGEPRSDDPEQWVDYPAECELGHAHVDALIRMACDLTLHDAAGESPHVWAPVHAWRALGQLRAEAAIEPLLAFSSRVIDDEATMEELPVVLGMIGPAVVPYLGALLGDRSHSPEAVSIAVTGLVEVAHRHPEVRTESVKLLTQVLEAPADSDPLLCGFVVSALLDLEAVEAIDVIRDAFRRDGVDMTIVGDVEDVELELGLRDRRTTPAPRHRLLPTNSVQRGDTSSTWMARGEPVRVTKVGRNEPCPCGSGKKYKKCCMT